jgi:hypothetical protein
MSAAVKPGSSNEHSKMVIEHRGGAERDVLVLGATTELLFNVEPVLQAGLVNSHDSLLEKTYWYQGGFLMAQLRSYRVSQRFWQREMIAALRFGAFVSEFQGDGSHNSP